MTTKVSAGRHGDAFWVEESNNFGTKMMEKMGWKQGTGLGKDSQGTSEFLRAKKKNDQSGIGAGAVTRDEMFAASTCMYNDLLKRLNATQSENNGSLALDGGGVKSAAEIADEESKVSSGVAIQKFMGRKKLYSKFKAAKESWKKSSTDLSAILGKSEAKEVPAFQTTNANVDLNTVVTTTSDVSMKDYFASKLGGKASDSGKAVTKFQTASGTGFTMDFQEAYYKRMMDQSLNRKGRTGLGGGAGGTSGLGSFTAATTSMKLGDDGQVTAESKERAATVEATKKGVAAVGLKYTAFTKSTSSFVPSEESGVTTLDLLLMERKEEKKKSKKSKKDKKDKEEIVEVVEAKEKKSKKNKKEKKDKEEQVEEVTVSSKKDKKDKKSKKKDKEAVADLAHLRRSPRLAAASPHLAPVPSLSLAGADEKKEKKKSKKKDKEKQSEKKEVVEEVEAKKKDKKKRKAEDSVEVVVEEKSEKKKKDKKKAKKE